MQTIGTTTTNPSRSTDQIGLRVAASVAAHGLAIGLIALGLHAKPRFVAPYRLPGSPHGSNFLLAYLPDRAPEQSAAAKKAEAKPARIEPTPSPLSRTTKALSAAADTTRASPDPNATTGADALGSGNITIALTSYFPPPRPDLAPVPRGTHGDVILRVVIGTDGRIADLKMVSGLGYGVDETVISTVQQWVFHPALQNGRPVASEQELHFHYEKG
ncbi:MAG: energy transducer TonB [Acidobacteriota bacterium]|nr:energy transducer TonB [Acidobacteriota bacterium]